MDNILGPDKDISLLYPSVKTFMEALSSQDKTASEPQYGPTIKAAQQLIEDRKKAEEAKAKQKSSSHAALDPNTSGLVKCFLPQAYQNLTFYQIIAERGIEGVEMIKEAYDLALTYAGTRHGLNSTEGTALRKFAVDLAMMSSGGGTADNQIQNFMTGFDKYRASRLPAHLEMSGPTFITRPRLCLQSSNLRNNPVMIPLDTIIPNSMAFAIRWLLDTNLATCGSTMAQAYLDAANKCPLINIESPWLTPMCNAVTSINGFPDIAMQTDTTDGGYFSEAQQFATGFDNFNRGAYSLNVTFREIPGGIISAMLFYWLEYIRCVTRGIMVAYPDDIDGLILNYTVSIYQFNMDPSYQYITRWCKCTGCFPTTMDLGSLFSKSENQYYQDAAQKVSTTFICNNVQYMNPNSLMDFNTLAMRYCHDINKSGDGAKYIKTDLNGKPNAEYKKPNIPYTPFSNFCGLPYITSDPNGFKLVYRPSSKDLFNDPIIQSLISYDIAATSKEWNLVEAAGGNRFDLYQKYSYEQFYKTTLNNFTAKYGTNSASFDKLVNDIMKDRYNISTNNSKTANTAAKTK